jgi:hypothetical protein
MGAAAARTAQKRRPRVDNGPFLSHVLDVLRRLKDVGDLPVFVQTLDCLPETIAERRRAPRRQPAHETVCRLTDCDGDEIACGLVWNLSVTGVSMLLNVRLEPGEQFGAELACAGGAGLRVGLAVVHVSRMRTGDYVLGAQFNRPLDEYELRPFVL